MDTEKLVFYCITAKGCGVCATLENDGTFKKIEDEMNKQGIIFRKVSLPSMKSRFKEGFINKGMIPFADKYMNKWFPMFVIGRKDVFDRMRSYSEGEVISSVSFFNGRISGGKLVQDVVYKNYGRENFSKFVNNYKSSLKKNKRPNNDNSKHKNKQSKDESSGPSIYSSMKSNHVSQDSNPESKTCERPSFNINQRYQ